MNEKRDMNDLKYKKEYELEVRIMKIRTQKEGEDEGRKETGRRR
jgi:hypothetical protein